MTGVKKMREAGYVAMQEKNYEKAIQIYSEALLMNDLPSEEKGLLHSNRSQAYLQSAIESGDNVAEKQKLALQDAEEVIKIRPTWWKGYFRAGQVYQLKSDWNPAIDLYDQALALNPGLVEVKKCRDECRYDQSLVDIQADKKSHAAPYAFEELIKKFNKERGLNLDAKAITEKYDLFMKSKNQKERATACVFFGEMYVQGIDVVQDYQKGAELFQEAADAGLPEAMCALGVLYMEGKGVPRNIEKAVNFFETVAQCQPQEENSLEFFAGKENYGVTHAQFQIGKCYQDGTGKPLDHYQACIWYRKASDAGHAGAANNLGILYQNGWGVEKCAVKAKQYWTVAATRGNVFAMDSLAWEYLMENELDQAKKWYERAIEAGNITSLLRKHVFYAQLEETRKVIKDVADLCPKISTPENPSKSEDVANLIDVIARVSKHKPNITENVELGKSPMLKYWTHLEEIQKRAENGHPFAKTLLMSMGYFADASDFLKKLCSKKTKYAEIEHVREQCIYNLANCFKTTEIVAFFVPSQVTELMKICKAKITTEKSRLVLSARIVYSYLLSASQSSEMLSFTKISNKLYPEEPFFYKIISGIFAINQNFEASMQVADQGLQRFPKDEGLLYCKAGAMKMIKSISTDEKIAAYKKFIEEAPFDERMIPEAYYNIAFYSLSEKSNGGAEKYYAKGLEEEQKLLPCFRPCESNTKSILEALLRLGGNGQQSQTSMSTEKACKSSEAATKLTNPARLRIVQRYRETFKKIVELHSQKCVLNVTVNPQYKHNEQIPKHFKDIKEITFRDMNSRNDQVYENRIINLLIIEDPMIGLLSAIHVVVRDDNGDCLPCSFYNLNHSDEYVRKNLCFGSKISLLHPYYRIATDGTFALRVDDPDTIIYHKSGKDNSICRYCWKEHPLHACGRCKRAKYCSRDCQVDDWKVLNHKLICELKYFKEGNM